MNEDHIMFERVEGTERTYDVQREWHPEMSGRADWVWEARVVLDYPPRVTRGAMSAGLQAYVLQNQLAILSVRTYTFRGVL